MKIPFGNQAIQDLILGGVEASIRFTVAGHGPQKSAELAACLKEFDNHWAPGQSASLACFVTTTAVLATNVLAKQCTHCGRQVHIQKLCRKRMREEAVSLTR